MARFRVSVRQLRILAAALIAGSTLAVGMVGTAAAELNRDPTYTHYETLPSPNPVPMFGTFSFSVRVGNVWTSMEDNFPHAFSIQVVTNVSGTTTSSCESIDVLDLGGGVINASVTLDEFNSLGSRQIVAVITEWNATDACGGLQTVRNVWHVDTELTIIAGEQTIDFDDPGPHAYGDAFALGATATSELAVSYATTGPCHVTSGTLHADGLGTCEVTASQAGNTWWQAAPDVTQSFSIGQRPLTLTVSNGDKFYGAANPGFGFTGNNWAPGENAGNLSGTAVYATAATEASVPGEYAVTMSGLTSANYAITFSPGTLNVLPQHLNVRANDASKIQGAPNPPLSATITGWVLGQDESVFTSSPDCVTTALTSSPVGSYLITCAGAAAPNYEVWNYPGTLTIAGDVDHVVISPSTATVQAGVNQAYTAEAFDSNGFSRGDVTASTVFTIAGGSCSGASCHSNVAGDHTVTGTHAGATDTATLTVAAAPAHHLAISPANGYILPGSTQTYTATLVDQFGNAVSDVTGSTTFSLDSVACAGAVCGPAGLGNHTVSAVSVVNQATLTASTTLHVVSRLPTPTPQRTAPGTGLAEDRGAGGAPLTLLVVCLAMGAFALMLVEARRRSHIWR